ncbi:MAG: flavin reductase family protein [Acidimicrobiia bacterium]
MAVTGVPEIHPVDEQLFKGALGRWASGVTVITAATADGPVGMAASSFSSVSKDPPLVLFCPAKSSSTWQQMQSVKRFGVNILAHDQADVCSVFARSGIDRFAEVEWSATESGTPALAGVSVFIECSVESVHDAGDHDIVVGRMELVGIHEDARPLVYHSGQYGRFEA